MGVALAALFAFGILDLMMMLWISRMPQLDSFTFAECVMIPISLFFLSGIVLRAVGFGAAPWPILVSCYTCVAILVFVSIAIRKNEIQQWSQTVKKSFVSALLFSAMHFTVNALFGAMLGV